MNSKNVIESQKAIYDAQLKEFGDSPESTHNQVEEIQFLRFERLLSNINLFEEGTTLHDIGCGICDMYTYLELNKSTLIYSGTDIVPGMKSLVNKKYPRLPYFIRDVIQDEVREKYDYTVLSGTFNLPGNIDRHEWKQFTRKMISAMYEMSNRGIVFNFLTDKADFYNPEMYYESIEEITDFCVNNLSRHLIIDHCYPLYEFTCTVLKPATVQMRYDHKTFEKYFKQ